MILSDVLSSYYSLNYWSGEIFCCIVLNYLKEQNDWGSMNVSSVNLTRMLKLFVLISHRHMPNSFVTFTCSNKFTYDGREISWGGGSRSEAPEKELRIFILWNTKGWEGARFSVSLLRSEMPRSSVQKQERKPSSVFSSWIESYGRQKRTDTGDSIETERTPV